MREMRMGEVTAKFADIIWEHQPITSAELARRSETEMGWKKTTAYTVLKRLCAKGVFKNENGVVTALMTKEQFRTLQSEQFIDDKFNGSLPAFLAAFTSKRHLSEQDVDALRKMVDEYKG